MSPGPEYRPLATNSNTIITAVGAGPLKHPGWCKRLHILKVVLVVGFLLTVINLYNYGFKVKFEKLSFLRNNATKKNQPNRWSGSATFSPPPPPLTFGPKRLHPNVELKKFLRHFSNKSSSSSSIKPKNIKAEAVEKQSIVNDPREDHHEEIHPNLQLLNNNPKYGSGTRYYSNSTNTTVRGGTENPIRPETLANENEFHHYNRQSPLLYSRVPQKLQIAQKNSIRNILVENPSEFSTLENSLNFDRPTTPESEVDNIHSGDRPEEIKTDVSEDGAVKSNTNSSTQGTKFNGHILTTSTRTVTFLSKLMTKLGINACPEAPPDLHGPIEVNLTQDTIAGVEDRLRPFLLPGGWFRPVECNAKDRVAIIIPFRDREEHLPILLKNLHPMLMRQQVNYGLFVVEETKSDPFNRASLMNVGFLEANKMGNWDCFIFHDVDLIPLDDRNLYRCPEQPRHMSVAVDVFDFKLPYFNIFGGVSALTSQQFHSVNGFSNLFWGWGGEDDDMSNRLRFTGYHISRYPMNIARYAMLNHPKSLPNPKRYEKLSNGLKRFENDGLNSVKYQIVDNKKFPLFTWLLVKLQPELSSGKPNTETGDHPLLKYCLLFLLATLLLCVFKLLIV